MSERVRDILILIGIIIIGLALIKFLFRIGIFLAILAVGGYLAYRFFWGKS